MKINKNISFLSEYNLKITLLSSFHTEIGRCNHLELYKIIERLQPDMIFEELPHNLFQSIYSGLRTPNTVESKAVSMYIRGNYMAQHFPVDSYAYNLEDLFFEYDFISNKSEEYNNLFTSMLSSIGNLGFRFLNSQDCTRVLSKLKSLELKILTENAPEELLMKYQNEINIHDSRETEMLKNIHHYSLNEPFNNALLICGTDHKQGILDKIATYTDKLNPNIKWSVYE